MKSRISSLTDTTGLSSPHNFWGCAGEDATGGGAWFFVEHETSSEPANANPKTPSADQVDRMLRMMFESRIARRRRARARDSFDPQPHSPQVGAVARIGVEVFDQRREIVEGRRSV